MEHSEILEYYNYERTWRYKPTCYNDEMEHLGIILKCYNNKMRSSEIGHKCYNDEMEHAGVNLQPTMVLNFPSQNSGCDASRTQFSISSPVTES
jgi:hypothetical protein